MAKMQGKVRAMLLKDFKKDQQVIFGQTKDEKDNPNIIGKIFDPSWAAGTARVITLSGVSISVPFTYIHTLVVEYKVENHNDFPSVRQASLKLSQWQAAIDNGEVDSDKTVDFEIIHGAVDYAKIIPAKKEILEKLTSHYDDDFLEKFDAFIEERVRLSSSLNSVAAYVIVKNFVHQHYKK